MTTNKYTREFRDFMSYPWPGKNMPEYYDWMNDAGDGNPGLQRMIQGYVSSYGAYHVIEGCTPQITGLSATGDAGWVMYSGTIKQVSADTGKDLTTNKFLIINPDGSWGSTGDKPTGVIIAANVRGTVYDVRESRWDANSKAYFPNTAYFYQNIQIYSGAIFSGLIVTTGNWHGHASCNVSGYKSVHAVTGQFSQITGFSDISIKASFDYGSTYHIKGAVQITGSVFSGSQFTGTSAYFPTAKITNIAGDMNFQSTYDVQNAVEITGTSGYIQDMHIITTNLLPIGTILMYDGTALGGTISTRTNQIGSEGGDTISMPGWYVCNGYSGTPNLIDRFIMGSATRGTSAGSNTFTLAVANIPQMTSATQSASHTHTVTISGDGSHVHNTPRIDGVGSSVYGGYLGITSNNYNVASTNSSHSHTPTVGNQSASHTHTVGTASPTAVDTRPAYYTVVFIKRIS